MVTGQKCKTKVCIFLRYGFSSLFSIDSFLKFSVANLINKARNATKKKDNWTTASNRGTKCLERMSVSILRAFILF